MSLARIRVLAIIAHTADEEVIAVPVLCQPATSARHLPERGDIQILNVTDRQYRDRVHFSDQGRTVARSVARKNPEQLVLF